MKIDDRHLRIDRVIGYIREDPARPLSLKVLSGISFYSIDHLPGLFRERTGETPKQYSLKLRLETAFHLLVVHPDQAISGIALDSGFSSPAVFSRAMKQYFGYTPEQLRGLSHGEQMRLVHEPSPGLYAPSSHAAPGVEIVRLGTIRGCYRMAPFNDPKAIREAFSELTGPGTSFYGILAPHQRNTYLAFLATTADLPFPSCEIKGGLFARFPVTGDLRQTNKTAHYFYRRWLPTSGYKISGVNGFETFDGEPSVQPYPEIQRYVHIPIERVRIPDFAK